VFIKDKQKGKIEKGISREEKIMFFIDVEKLRRIKGYVKLVSETIKETETRLYDRYYGSAVPNNEGVYNYQLGITEVIYILYKHKLYLLKVLYLFILFIYSFIFLKQIKEIKDTRPNTHGIKATAKIDKSISKNDEGHLCKPVFPDRFGKSYDRFQVEIDFLIRKNSETSEIVDIPDYVKVKRDDNDMVSL
jgi:hypothetical protein